MPGFNWDDIKDDPMADGFDPEPEPAPVPVVSVRNKPNEPAKMTLTMPAPKAQPMNVEAALEEMEESAGASVDKLTEAEWRLEKAQFYRAVINSQLLSSEHPAAIEVEKELQSWAVEQMEILLGIRAVDGVATNKFASKLAELEDRFLRTPILKTFSPDEEAALKAVAARVLGNKPAPQPAIQQAPAAVKISPIPQVKPAVAKVQTAIRPVATPPRVQTSMARKPAGRPRVNPCKLCGLMDCGHKVNQTKIPEGAKIEQVASSDTFQGVQIKIVDGKRVVDMPNGVRYRLDRRKVQYKDGVIKEEDIPTELAVAKINSRALPYPSEQEAMALAAVEGAQSEGRIQQSAIFAKIVDAAQKAPDRESYIPQPPPRKR